MCCTSKKKPVPPPQPQPQPQPQYPNRDSNMRASRPQSRIIFTSQNMASDVFRNQEAFLPTEKINHRVNDHIDRNQHYARQIANSRDSKLIASPDIMNCELDAWDGITRLPAVDTFHYESVLSHCFLHGSLNEISGFPVGYQKFRGSPENQGRITGNNIRQF